MFLEKTKQNGQTHLEVRSNFQDKWKGYLFLSVFLAPWVVIFFFVSLGSRSLVSYLLFFVFLALYIILMGYHYWYSRHVLCIVDPSSQRLIVKRFMSGTAIPLEDCKKVVLRRKYHLWYQFGKAGFTTVNPEEELRKEFGHLYDINLEWAPPPWMRQTGDKRGNQIQVSWQVNVKKRKMAVFAARWLDVTNKPEIIEKYRSSTSFQVGPYDSVMTNLLVTDKAKYLEMFVGIETHSGMNQPVKVLDVQMDEVTAFRQLAEELAEELGIPLVDETGMEVKVREQGYTDKFLGDTIKEQIGGDLDLDKITRDTKNIQVEITNDHITRLRANLDELQGGGITTTKWIGYIALTLLCLLFVISSVELYSDILTGTNFSSFSENPVSFILNLTFRIAITSGILFLSIIGFRFGILRMNSVKRVLDVTIDDNFLTVRQKGKFFSVMKGAIPLRKVEDVIVVQRWDWPRIEIVSDNKRIHVDGYLAFSTAHEIKALLGITLATWA